MSDEYRKGYRDGFADGWSQRQPAQASLMSTKCSVCNITFDINTPYSYVCGNSKCPIMPRITSSLTGGTQT